MVCANAHAPFLRELDLFRNKVGLKSSGESYAAETGSELRDHAEKFGLFGDADHDLEGSRRV